MILYADKRGPAHQVSHRVFCGGSHKQLSHSFRVSQTPELPLGGGRVRAAFSAIAFLLFSITGFTSSLASAADALAGDLGSLKPSPAAPLCSAYGRPLPVNNEQILRWKKSTNNQFKERGHVLGRVTKVYPSRPNHDHFQIAFSDEPGATLEVVYNSAFGALPELKNGDVIQACGDYITSTAQSGPYPASPDGAIIHWVHRNPRNSGHEHGFVVVNDKVYGNDVSNATRDR